VTLAEETRWLDALDQAELVRKREVTAAELVAAAGERIKETAPLNAVVLDLVDRALEGAKGALPDSPVAGAPFLLKDLGGTLGGVRETMGSRALAEHVPAETSPLVQSYLDAGLQIAGKTNTPEFGNYCTTESELLGIARNPWNPERTAGGSSGGSAIAVAVGAVAAASGGDGTGSIRIPASCCGVVGLKPARGRVSSAPEGDAMSGLVGMHALTRSVRDSAALLDVIAGLRTGDPYGPLVPADGFLSGLEREPGPQRILLALDPAHPGELDPRIRSLVEETARTLEGLGHAISPGTPGYASGEAVRHAVALIHGVENLRMHAFAAGVLGRDPAEDELEPVTWQMVRLGERISGAEHADAVDEMRRQARTLVESCAGHDVVLCPTLNVPPPPLGTLNGLRESVDAFFDTEFAHTGWTSVANVTGWAAITLPLGLVDGLPAGVQLMGPSESVLLGLARQLEQATPWELRPPAVS
jgi:amidase